MSSPPSSWHILVAGAAGAIGSGIVAELVETGAHVIAVDRDETGLRRLQQELPGESLQRLSSAVCELSSPEGVAELAKDIPPPERGLNGLVSCLGAWWEGGLLREVPVLQEWEKVAASTIVPQLLLAHEFVPMLAENEKARCLWINGGTAVNPQPKAGLVNIASAAQLMLARVLNAEEKGLSSATLLLEGPVRSRKLLDPNPEWMDSRGVGAACVRILSAQRFESGAILRAGNAEELSKIA
jgi:NAD(P)-dependent dehydrogenase (short-subunit alcohol dehydrogenase family)